MNLSPFGELFKKSWELYKKKIPTLAIFFAVSFILSVLQALTTHQTNSHVNALSDIRPATAGTAALVFLIIGVGVTLWMQAASIKAIDSSSDKPNATELLSQSASLILPYLWVAVLAGLAIVGGLVLLIVPGIIFAIWFSMSTFTLVLDGQRGTQALKSSKALVQGRFGAVFGRIILLLLCLLGISIVASIVFALLPETLRAIAVAAVSSFLIAPLSLVFTYLLYQELKTHLAPAKTTSAA